MSTQVGQVYSIIGDKSGAPLDNGFVYIGESGQNPENYPIQIYYDEDFTIPAPQPLRTINGYFSRNGSPAKIFINAVECSIVVKDRFNILQWSDLNYAGLLSGKGINASNVQDASGETQQQVNYNGGSKWHSRIDGYKQNERVVLTDGDIVKSTDGGNTNDPNVNMDGWVKDNSASQIFDASGKTQQEINDLRADKTYVDSQDSSLQLQINQKAETVYVDAAVGAISTDASKQYATLALANADIANIALNKNIFVSEAANGGYWYKATAGATTLTKSPFDPVLAAKNYTDQSLVTVKNDYLNLDQITDFRQSLINGVYGPDFTTLSTATLSFVGGQAVISQPTSTEFIRSIDTSHQIVDGTKRILKLKFKIEDVSTANGAAIFIGESLGVVYYSNGGLAVVDKNWQSQTALATSFTDANLSYAANESVELEIQLNGDGSGVAIAKKSNGYNRSLAFTGMQKGKVYLASRRMIANKTFTFEKFSIVENTVTSTAVNKAMNQAVTPIFDYATDGFFSAVNDKKSSQYKYNLMDGKIALDTTETTVNSVFYAKVGVSYSGGVELEVGSKVLTGSGAVGMCLVVGDGASRKIFAYLKSGLIGTLTAAGGLDQGSVQGAMAYENNQVAKLRLSIADGVAILTAIHPNGTQATLRMTGVPVGNVYVGWRGSATTSEIQYLSKVNIATSVITMESKIEQLNITSQFPKTWKVLPDSEVGRTTKGFTCTGLAKITAGNFRESWAVGDDGRLEEADGSPFKPRIHILDGAFNRILLTIDPQYTSASLQGVTFDTLTNEHVWAACSGNGTIRKFSLVDSSEVVTDRITVADLSLSLTPNAIAFDATRGTGKGALWVGDSSGLMVYLIDADPAASTRVIQTITLVNNPDMFQLIDNNTLLYQSAGNGTRATVYNYDLATNTEFAKWASLECWFAAEGFYYDKTWRTLYAVNDAGYHKSIASGPRFNCVFEYILNY